MLQRRGESTLEVRAGHRRDPSAHVVRRRPHAGPALRVIDVLQLLALAAGDLRRQHRAGHVGGSRPGESLRRAHGAWRAVWARSVDLGHVEPTVTHCPGSRTFRASTSRA